MLQIRLAVKNVGKEEDASVDKKNTNTAHKGEIKWVHSAAQQQLLYYMYKLQEE
jgi:hypothetical protein